jgi:aspartate aminotransferase/aminotransferase
MTSRRSALVNASGIRKVFDLALTLKNPINLSIGQPDFDVPEPVKESAIAAIREGKNRYTVTQGIAPLHERIRAEAAKYGYHPEEVLITSGSSGGLVLAMLALCDPGDEILVPDPYFVMYKHLANLFAVTPRFIDTYPDFRLSAEKIEPLINKRTRMLIVNTPSNPTGVAYSPDQLKMVAQIAKRHDLYVLFDEIYSCFSYDHRHESITKYHDRVVVLNGFSKSHAMTGWRLGYAMGPRDVIQEMTKLQQYTFVCAPSMVQYAGLTALDLPMTATQEAYKRKRDIIYEGLKGRFNVRKPDGAFYIFPEAPGGNATEFVMKALKHNVLIIPGNVFSERDTHFRISFAAPDETLRKGAEVLCGLA